mgnify:CR=1 FL=1
MGKMSFFKLQTRSRKKLFFILLIAFLAIAIKIAGLNLNNSLDVSTQPDYYDAVSELEKRKQEQSP